VGIKIGLKATERCSAGLERTVVCHTTVVIVGASQLLDYAVILEKRVACYDKISARRRFSELHSARGLSVYV
jgi:hypothetical protein